VIDMGPGRFGKTNLESSVFSRKARKNRIFSFLDMHSDFFLAVPIARRIVLSLFFIVLSLFSIVLAPTAFLFTYQ